ncbi:MAG: DUF3142 domain-containing protein [Blastocatellia bacterium]|nr:DUF3142 domain-containing protein [Blastocatellia bacterium]
MQKTKKIVLVAIVLSILSIIYLLIWDFSYRSNTDTLPKIMLWAWERSENLMFIDSKSTGVAFLAKTILLKEDKVDIRPRLQPLAVAPNTVLVAVVRIETSLQQPPELSEEQLRQTIKAIKSVTKLNIIGLQIDFDAKLSERKFYKELLEKLRRELPKNYLLSITALASWAMYDNWIADLPVDEVVPMLFSLGVEKQQLLSYLAAKKDFRTKNTQTSIGISTGEDLPWLPAKRRIYIFANQSWSKELLEDVLQKVEKWQTK